jgi:hypothetical protein
MSVGPALEAFVYAREHGLPTKEAADRLLAAIDECERAVADRTANERPNDEIARVFAICQGCPEFTREGLWGDCRLDEGCAESRRHTFRKRVQDAARACGAGRWG